ncbi:MAG: methyltransferase, TIGR04325 family [Pseudomonadota bacterium]
MSRLKQLVELAPWGRDLAMLWRNRHRGSRSFAGVFPTFDAAQTAASVDGRGAYDNQNQSKTLEDELAGIDQWFDQSDYALLHWVTQWVGAGDRVVDLGGSVGHTFYTFDRLQGLPTELTWQIQELPAAVALGQQIARHKRESRLRFSTDWPDQEAGKTDVLLSAGTLQYMPINIDELLRRVRPERVLLHHLPSTSGAPFWTVQLLNKSSVPYQIFSWPQVQAALSDAGYEIIDEWWQARRVDIPFKRKAFADAYRGLAARRNP